MSLTLVSLSPASSSSETSEVRPPEAADGACRAGPPIVLRWRGVESYEVSFDAMRAFTDARNAQTSDEIWLVEHPPVFTLGQAGDPAHLLAADCGIPLVKVDRGGQITYHGPGQLVLYVLVDLRRTKVGIRTLVRTLEAAVVEWLGKLGIAAHGKASAPGVYVSIGGSEAKVAALGLKVRNGCTYHGLAVNVAMDLGPFADIDPCGYAGLAVAQLADFGVKRTVGEAGAELATILAADLEAMPRP